MEVKITKDIINPFWITSEFQHFNRAHPVKQIIFSNEGAKRRKPLFKASFGSTNKINAYWKDEKSGILEVSAIESGFELNAGTELIAYFNDKMFPQTVEVLDVTHLDVSHVRRFDACFLNFGKTRNSKVVGLETWNVSSGEIFSRMFDGFCIYADEIVLDFSGWDVSHGQKASEMFSGFGYFSKHIELKGIESWNVESMAEMIFMFQKFGVHSDCKLDLSNWKPAIFDALGTTAHTGFAANTFFKIKEPTWPKRDDT